MANKKTGHIAGCVFARSSTSGRVMKSVYQEGSFCFNRLPAQEFFLYNTLFGELGLPEAFVLKGEKNLAAFVL